MYCSYCGLVALEATTTTVDAEIFFDFACCSLIPNKLPFDGSSPRSVAVMDDCSIHHADSVKEPFRQAGILLIFLPSYIPDLNPIELVFARVKQFLKENDELLQLCQIHYPSSKQHLTQYLKTIVIIGVYIAVMECNNNV